MTYTDEQLDSFLDMMGVKLLSYQREMFKKLVNTDKVYISMVPKVGMSEYMFMTRMLEVVLQGGSDIYESKQQTM